MQLEEKQQENDVKIALLHQAIEQYSCNRKLEGLLFSWAAKELKEIEIVKFTKIDLLQDLKLSWLRKNIKAKRCFKNAHRLHQLFPQIDYVEGFCLNVENKLITHAWNSYEGKHFDLTHDCIGGSGWFLTYYQVICLDAAMLKVLKPKVNYWGEHMMPFFQYKEIDTQHLTLH